MVKIKAKSRQAVIFDMDGVVLDSEPIYDKNIELFLNERDLNVRPELVESLRGTDGRYFWQQIKLAYDLQDSLEDLILMDQKRLDLTFKTYPGLEVMAGLIDLLSSLEKAEIKIALASSSNRTRVETIIERLELSRYFSTRISGCDVTQAKPKPDIFLLTANKLNVQPSHCVVIEDSYNGLLAAKAAGMKCIGLRGSANQRQDLNSADIVIDSLRELNAPRVLSLIGDIL